MLLHNGQIIECRRIRANLCGLDEHVVRFVNSTATPNITPSSLAA